MPFLQFSRLVPIISEQDPVHFLTSMNAARYIRTYIKARVTITAILPVNQVNFFFVDEKIHIPGVPMDIASVNAVFLGQLMQFVATHPQFCKTWEIAILLLGNLGLYPLSLFYNIEVVPDPAGSFVEAAK